ncbi:hypothetical protein GCM10009549_47150 [Streptomyces thermoalcalitolerans]|uniref:Uncharacterized protein n=1 Tax=Streptomyces thermoalcalitolerans TaxID=65605 RepID=A0ABN1PC15_9ACTN
MGFRHCRVRGAFWAPGTAFMVGYRQNAARFPQRWWQQEKRVRGGVAQPWAPDGARA